MTPPLPGTWPTLADDGRPKGETMETGWKVAQALLERVGPREAKGIVWSALEAGRIDGYQAVAVLAWVVE